MCDIEQQSPADATTAGSYTVQGMTCGSCATKVTRAVTEVPGVETTAVDLTTGTLTVDGDYDDGAIRTAITNAGYQTT